MNRQDRDRNDYGRYDGYNNDEHYHASRNLTNEFEQHYRGERGHDDGERHYPQRSYHEGSEIEDAYNRQRRTNDNYSRHSDRMRNERENDTYYFGDYNDNQDNYRGNEGYYREDRDNYRQYGDRPMSSGLADDYGSFNRSNYSGSRDQRDYNTGSRNDYRSSRESNRDYSQGSGYMGRYGAEEHDKYSRESRPIRNDRWYDSNERTRYY